MNGARPIPSGLYKYLFFTKARTINDWKVIFLWTALTGAGAVAPVNRAVWFRRNSWQSVITEAVGAARRACGSWWELKDKPRRRATRGPGGAGAVRARPNSAGIREAGLRGQAGALHAGGTAASGAHRDGHLSSQPPDFVIVSGGQVGHGDSPLPTRSSDVTCTVGGVTR